MLEPGDEAVSLQYWLNTKYWPIALAVVLNAALISTFARPHPQPSLKHKPQLCLACMLNLEMQTDRQYYCIA